MQPLQRIKNLDLRLCNIFSSAAIATQPDAKRQVIKELRLFARLARRGNRPELAAEALRMEYDLVAELHQAGQPYPEATA
ncbi:hypothetical protein AN401_07070 [Zobellella denitrificans]|uniref:Uncharacterized protein n=1 Tax=Zobellella denitrificans TaxID=347534 RepID=A0A291HNB9_9GAMM|nr:hypothetical protein [Zobellella denitrificans]ATG73645.1 hypothetical protein AN401_07070 [Zobellella denitrificans]